MRWKAGRLEASSVWADTFVGIPGREVPAPLSAGVLDGAALGIEAVAFDLLFI
jgi:hypothetical protein